MSDELKPCPFCGRADNIVMEAWGTFAARGFCHNCGAVGPPDANEATAIENWNRRAADERVAELVAVVEDMLSGLTYLRVAHVAYDPDKLSGFGIDRLEAAGRAALAKHKGATSCSTN